ncbi:hypothetical protein ACHAQJ_000138 [Trichoderma viride]
MAPQDRTLLDKVLSSSSFLFHPAYKLKSTPVTKPKVWEKAVAFRNPDLGFSILFNFSPMKEDSGGELYDGNGLDKARIVLMCSATLALDENKKTYEGSRRNLPFSLAITDLEKFLMFIENKRYPYEAFDRLIYNAFDKVLTQNDYTYSMPIDVPAMAYPAQCEVVKTEVVSLDG